MYSIGDLVHKVRPEKTQLVAILFEHDHRLAAAFHPKDLLLAAVSTVKHIADSHRQLLSLQPANTPKLNVNTEKMMINVYVHKVLP